jgi:hypothetical protein
VRKNKFYYNAKYKTEDDNKIYNKNGKHIGDMVEGKYVKLTEVDVQLSNLYLSKPPNFTSWICVYTEGVEERAKKVENKTEFYLTGGNEIFNSQGICVGLYIDDGEVISEDYDDVELSELEEDYDDVELSELEEEDMEYFPHATSFDVSLNEFANKDTGYYKATVDHFIYNEDGDCLGKMINGVYVVGMFD